VPVELAGIATPARVGEVAETLGIQELFTKVVLVDARAVLDLPAAAVVVVLHQSLS
jgi:hypothetical protein